GVVDVPEQVARGAEAGAALHHADQVVAVADEVATHVLAELRDGQDGVVGDDRVLHVDVVRPAGPLDAAAVEDAEVLDDGAVEEGPVGGEDAAAAGEAVVAADGAVGQVQRAGLDAAAGAAGVVAADGAAGHGRRRGDDAAAAAHHGGVAADGAVDQGQV